MIENENGNELKEEMRINSYMWIKIIQAVILMVLGASLVMIGFFRVKDNGDTTSSTIAYCIGIAFATYGVINVVSGYLLERSPIAKEVIMGIIFTAVGISIIIKPDVIMEILPLLLIVIFYLFGIMFIVYGVDRIIGKDINKSTSKGSLMCVLSATMFALATVYVFYYKDESLLNYVLMGIGILLLILGVVSTILLVIRVKNTKKIIKEREIQRKQEEEREKDEKETELKIIDISELKKKTGKKVYNKEKNETQVLIPEETPEESESTEIVIVPDTTEVKTVQNDETNKKQNRKKKKQ